MSATTHSITLTVECFYLASFESSAWLPDGQSVTYWQAYCPLTNLPVGPRGGDVNPAYIRLWMAEKHPAAVECEIVSIPTVTEMAVAR